MLLSKRFPFSALLIVCCIPSLVLAQTPSKTIKIQDASLVRLALKDSLTSATNRADDPVRFEVTQDVKVGDQVVIPEGSTARGHVVEAKPKTTFGSGKLNFTVDHVDAPDGASIRLRASTQKGGDPSGSLLMAPFNLVLGWKDVNIPKGTQFNTYIDGDQEIALGAPARARDLAPALQQPAAPTTPQEPSTVVVKSTPDGADITVDGRYMGSTPSTLQLAPGEHLVKVERSGYRQWERIMSVTSGGIITIDARLESQ